MHNHFAFDENTTMYIYNICFASEHPSHFTMRMSFATDGKPKFFTKQHFLVKFIYTSASRLDAISVFFSRNPNAAHFMTRRSLNVFRAQHLMNLCFYVFFLSAPSRKYSK